MSGRLWGAIVVSSLHAEPLPEGTEARLADFTEMLASAIENTESRAALERLADEQAALRRVATLVAQGVPSAEMFSAVSDEVDGLFDCGAGVARFEEEPPATVFAGVSKRITVPIGTRFEFQDGMASVEVYRTHRSARVDANDWTTSDDLLATTARRFGLVSSVRESDRRRRPALGHDESLVDGCATAARHGRTPGEVHGARRDRHRERRVARGLPAAG